MVYTETVKIGIKDVEKANYLSNKAILKYLENVAAHHSDSVGYGINTMDETKLSWVLLEWKVKVIKRIQYGQTLKVSTWAKSVEKCYGNRNFAIHDEDGNLCVIAASKWLLIDIEKGKIAKASQEMADLYKSEPEKRVFGDVELEKIQMPKSFERSITYTVKRRDIDIVGHMHNLYYLDLAYEVLPDEIYEKRLFDNIRITYKKEIKYGQTIKCKYSYENNKNVVVITSEDESIIHSIIELY